MDSYMCMYNKNEIFSLCIKTLFPNFVFISYLSFTFVYIIKNGMVDGYWY